MKKLSDIYKELGIDFTCPIVIKDANGNETYYENGEGRRGKCEYDTNGTQTYYEGSTGYWWRREYDADGNQTYYENSEGYWIKHEHDSNGTQTYFEDSTGYKEGIPRSELASQSCAGKIVEVDGKKYKLTEL